MKQMGDTTNVMQNSMTKMRREHTKAKKLQMVAEHQESIQFGSSRTSQECALNAFGQNRKKNNVFFSLSTQIS